MTKLELPNISEFLENFAARFANFFLRALANLRKFFRESAQIFLSRARKNQKWPRESPPISLPQMATNWKPHLDDHLAYWPFREFQNLPDFRTRAEKKCTRESQKYSARILEIIFVRRKKVRKFGKVRREFSGKKNRESTERMTKLELPNISEFLLFCHRKIPRAHQKIPLFSKLLGPVFWIQKYF